MSTPDENVNIDPTRTLNDIRSASRRLDGNGDKLVQQLVDDVGDLDEWIGQGGYLPDQWRNARRGRPRLEEEGPVRHDVRHGTRTAYNAGCHCFLCRKANRDAAATYRARLKEEKKS